MEKLINKILLIAGLLAVASLGVKPQTALMAVVEVAHYTTLGQTSNVSTMTVYTPIVEGDFLVTVCWNSPNQDPNSGSSILVDVGYTDGSGAGILHDRISGSVGYSATENPTNEMTWLVHSLSGNSIQLFTEYNAGATSYPYNLYVKVVKI
jgi:hypothetical protein